MVEATESESCLVSSTTLIVALTIFQIPTASFSSQLLQPSGSVRGTQLDCASCREILSPNEQPHIHGARPSGSEDLTGLNRLSFLRRMPWDQPSSATHPQTVPSQTVVHFDNGADLKATLTLTHEVLYDPEESLLFSRPQTYPAVAEDGRMYWVDFGDSTVHVTDEQMNHLFSIGRAGQGPGEFSRPWLAAISPGGNLFVLDSQASRLSKFTLGGEFIDSYIVPSGIGRAQNLIMLSDTRFIVNVTSLQPMLHGAAAHVFRLEELDERAPQAIHVDSFAETPPYDLGVYTRVAGGQLTRDLDGGFLYTQRTRYRLSKFDRSGNVVWTVNEPAAFPDALQSFRLNARGVVEAPRYPRSLTVLPLGDGLYLHTVVFPPDGFEDPREPVPEGVHWQISFELVRVKGGDVTKTIAEVPESLHYVRRGPDGRLYGFMWGDRRFLLRSTFDRVDPMEALRIE